MTKSNIYQKLLDIQNENLVFTKNAENPYFKSSYLSLDELLKELKPMLKKYGLVVIHYAKDNFVCTEVRDVESDTFLVSAFPLNPSLKPQEIGSAITYAKRYNIGQLFNIMTDSDDDGNASNAKNAPAINYGSQTTTKVPKTPQKGDKVTKMKSEIATLLEELVSNPLFSKEDYLNECKNLTDLELKEENYEQIIARLDVLKQEKNGN